jgi:hypothetical protein
MSGRMLRLVAGSSVQRSFINPAITHSSIINHQIINHQWLGFVCEPLTDVVHVLDRAHQPVMSFGGHGSALGQLDRPSDAALVVLDRTESTGDPVVAVADRGNDRVQLFEIDGAPLAVIAGDRWPRNPGWSPRAAWPFFRVASIPRLSSPTRLEWHAPFLDVTCASGIVRIHLAGALLPDFEQWLAEASSDELARALRRFSSPRHTADVPADYVRRIAARLQPESLIA